eukprot:3937915-Rhodomonas_salina.1
MADLEDQMCFPEFPIQELTYFQVISLSSYFQVISLSSYSQVISLPSHSTCVLVPGSVTVTCRPCRGALWAFSEGSQWKRAAQAGVTRTGVLVQHALIQGGMSCR